MKSNPHYCQNCGEYVQKRIRRGTQLLCPVCVLKVDNQGKGCIRCGHILYDMFKVEGGMICSPCHYKTAPPNMRGAITPQNLRHRKSTFPTLEHYDKRR